jgi:predicted ribonuclease YlaK/intein/homing endonuclease
MKKIYVLDTSVCLTSANSLYSFKNSDIIIPIKVLEEIDGHKKRQDVVGSNARQTIRILDALRQKGSLSEGVRLAKGKGIIKVINSVFSDIMPPEMSKEAADNKIISCALKLSHTEKDKKIILVSRDINMRVIANSLGIIAEDFEGEHVIDDGSKLYTGTFDLVIDDEVIDRFYKGEEIYLDKTKTKNLYANQFVKLISNSNEKKTALSRFTHEQAPLLQIRNAKSMWGVSARNTEQRYALDLLLDPAVPVVSLVGRAGSGKSLLALVGGLEQVLGKDNRRYDRLLVSKPVQSVGKEIGFLPGPQPLDAKILTPDGWTTMGEVKEGDFVISREGNPTRVLGVFPKGKKKVFKVTTTDGTSTECCEDHLWNTRTREERKRGKIGQVRSTKEIINTLVDTGGKINHFLPRNEAIQYFKKELPIAPYTMGVLLGDGSIGNSVSISNTDLELLQRVSSELESLNCYLTNDGRSIVYNIRSKLYNNKPARQVLIVDRTTGVKSVYDSVGKAVVATGINRSTIASRCEKEMFIDNKQYKFLDKKENWSNPVKNITENLGLTGCKAWEKFVPEIYKYSSINDRLELLRGLMDTDGTVKKTGEASFTTTSKKLADDVVEIVRSLGGRASRRERNRIGKKSLLTSGRHIVSRRISYEFTVSLPQNMNPFYVSRKSERHNSKYIHSVGILSVEDTGKEKEVQCIRVDNDEHLYITDDFIVTHNTLEEKMMPWLKPIQDNLQFLMGNDKGMMQDYMDKGIIEVEAISYIRGRSIANSYMIIEECQNLTQHEIKTIITRVGENTKIVLTGDVEQIDNAYIDETSNGLSNVVEKFKPSLLAGHVLMQKGERSLVATLASEVL